MLERFDEIVVTLAICWPLALVAVGVLAWRGMLRREALSAGPVRAVGLEPLDVAVAMILPLIMLMGGLARRWSPPEAPVLVPEQLQRVDGAYALRMMLINQAVMMLPFVGWLMIRSRRAPEGWRRVGFVPRKWLRELWVSAVALLVAFVWVLTATATFAALQLAMGRPVPTVAHDALVLLKAEPSVAVRMGLVVSAFIVAPVLEEIIFRGLLQTSLLELLGWDKRWRVVTATAALFAAVHVANVPWHVLPGLFLLGGVLGWLYERMGSLWPCFLVHAGFNGINLAAALSGLADTK